MHVLASALESNPVYDLVYPYVMWIKPTSSIYSNQFYKKVYIQIKWSRRVEQILLVSLISLLAAQEG
jgi:hypothetical protein